MSDPLLSESIQNYLKVIYKLEKNLEEASTSDIAKELNISSASVTGMLKRLSAMRLVNYNSYKGVTLTKDGKALALEVIRHHRLIEVYLRQSLGYKLAKIHDEACKLEHYVSKDFIDKITEILDDPEFDPCGHPIPTKDGAMPAKDESSLIDFEPIITATISSLNDENVELLNYLDDVGLLPGKKITLLEKSPYYGPIRLTFDDKEISIGHEVAKMIFIDKKSIKHT
jgi:DtxR family Mn-dependent transcriptional regulator